MVQPPRPPLPDTEPMEPERVLHSTELELDGARWQIVLYLHHHGHHLRIERDGELIALHNGSLPESWPGDAYPSEVQRAVADIAERLSWNG